MIFEEVGSTKNEAIHLVESKCKDAILLHFFFWFFETLVELIYYYFFQLNFVGTLKNQIILYIKSQFYKISFNREITSNYG